jgi:hypothetical protein
MTEEIIKQKLDTLAEYYSQKDALELSKRELLDEVKVPAETEQIVSAGMREAEQADSEYGNSIALFSKQLNERIAQVVIPQGYKDALAEIDRQREEILSKMGEVEQEKRAIKSELDEYQSRQQQFHDTRKNEIRAKIDRQTRDVYDEITKRKTDIEIEFSGKAQDVEANIKKLEAEIKADVKAAGASVKGKFFHAVYVKGRVTWNTDKMDAWCNDHPFLKDARKEGEPSITLRKV